MFNVRNHYVYIAVFCANIGGFLASSTVSWSSTILSKLKQLDDNPLGRAITDAEESLLSSIPTVGALFGSFVCGYISRRYGRRHGLMFEAIPSLLAYILLFFSTTVWEMYIARFLAGLTLGSFYTVNPIYFGEVAEKSNRGILGLIMVLYERIGSIFILVLGPSVSFRTFNIVMSVVPAMFVTVTFFFIPESPYFLVQNDYCSAKTSLKKLRGRQDVTSELNEIKEFVDNCPKISINDFFSNKGLRKSLLIGCTIVSFQQLSGSLVITSYSEQIFKDTGEKISCKLGPIILAIIGLIMACLIPLIIDRSGRKIFLISSHILSSLSEIPLGLYFLLQKSDVDVDNIFWLPIACLITFTIFNAVGVNCVPWIIVGEIFPMEYKEAGMGICNLVVSVVAFLLLQSFNPMKNFLGTGPTFWTYSAFGAIGAIFVKYYVIETKGKSLEEIQKILNV